ncbi:hypothetical protein L596_025364 [Steinernema carpocapsae]|uniref:Uncharacterized protein n=1 Tax=Steinernema carpocapsae TaxID=34508 RepID=A0A4U5M7J2_STECR|nr:hypothetical protein L596_025364 [Steinernema carpocapsae]
MRLPLFLLSILLIIASSAFAQKPEPVDCYWTQCLTPWDTDDACARGFYVEKWEYCIWPLKKQFCCPGT